MKCVYGEKVALAARVVSGLLGQETSLQTELGQNFHPCSRYQLFHQELLKSLIQKTECGKFIRSVEN